MIPETSTQGCGTSGAWNGLFVTNPCHPLSYESPRERGAEMYPSLPEGGWHEKRIEVMPTFASCSMGLPNNVKSRSLLVTVHFPHVGNSPV